MDAARNMMADGMQQGAVVLMDALGFKGIWERHPAEQVLGKLSALREIHYVDRKVLNRLGHPVGIHREIQFRALSDTIIIAVPVVDEFQSEKAALRDGLALAGALAALYQARALTGSPPHFSFRGALSVGRLALHEEFLVGPAIDEAAEWYESANGAFVVLTPSATSIMQDPAPGLDDAIVRDWEVPLKKGGVFRMPAVDCLRPADTHEHRAEMVSNMKESFLSEDPRVIEKWDHTRRFLEHCRALPLFVPPAERR